MLPLPTVRAGPNGPEEVYGSTEASSRSRGSRASGRISRVGARPQLGITNCDAFAHAQRFQSTAWSGKGFAVDAGRAMTARYPWGARTRSGEGQGPMRRL